MKLFFGLIWTLSQVCWALEGPQRVSARVGGSVSLQCKYRKGDEESVKFWCREESPHFCSSSHLVRTTGSEAEVMVSKTSIKDNRTFRKFSVTIKNLTDTDAGTYLCGIERRDFDISHQVEVIITPALFRNRKPTTEDSSGPTIATESIQSSNTDFLLLVFLKIPICLVMVSAVVWVHVWYNKGRSPWAKKHQDDKNSSKQSQDKSRSDS